MTTRSNLAELLADPGSSAPAIVATSPFAIVSYKALAGQIERLSGQLRGAGLKPGDSVALVLPNGLEFIVVFLALAHASLVAAPLNPADKPDEIRFFLKDAQVRAAVAEGSNLAVREAAAGLGLPVWQPRVDSRGVVELPELPQGSRTSLDAPHPDDVALFAYTSGTTGRPKCVPLTHANVLWSSRNTAEHYVLTASDRGWVVLPLFHGHGTAARSLADGSPTAGPIFDEMVTMAEQWLVRSDEDRPDTPATDRRIRAALVTAMKTGIPLLHEHVSRALGVDMFAPEGERLVALALLDMYSHAPIDDG